MIERVLLVAAVALVVVVAIVVLRRRPIVRAREVEAAGLPPGIYLMTSDGCDTCARARQVLTRRSVAYTELSWEKNPEVFDQIGVDAVPSVLRIDEGGRGTWWRGGVPSRLGRS